MYEGYGESHTLSKVRSWSCMDELVVIEDLSFKTEYHRNFGQTAFLSQQYQNPIPVFNWN